jgi:hypothetical protein
MKYVDLNQNRTIQNKSECIICGEMKSKVAPFVPCENCTKQFLKNAVLLVEKIGNGEHEEPTGRVMVIRDIAFEQVFNMTIPVPRIVKVEIGILQRMEDHIANTSDKKHE